ncbi:MAG TPA: hypothetical protein VF590_17165, partial [Isosphaeraceae bacterium]
MAQPFVVVDLAPGARDFQPVALEPGRPMLDRLKANYQVLRAWLGEYAAEPEPAGGDVVGFLIPARVRAGAEAGGVAHRPVVDACVPATPRDLAGPLRKQLDELRRLIQQATPKSETERALHRVLLRARDAQLDPGAEHPGCILFKYRDPAGTWRLVWCWGYRRRDEGLGEPVVHDGRLYFRRPGERLADLVGSGAVVDVDEDAPRSRRRRRLRVAGILSSVLLLAIGGTVGWLAANPGNWKRVKDWIVPPPPAPIILDGSTSARPDNNKGTSPVPRPSDSESSTEPPFTLAITAEGPEVIPVGQTVLLRAWKDYGDDRRELLADAPEWKADEEVAGLTLQPDGMVEATQPGAGPLKIRAVYRGKRSDETKESNELQFRGGPAVPVTLAITAPRPTLLVGESGQLTLSATDEQGLPVDLAEGRAEFALAPGAGAGILDLTSDGGYRALGAGPVTVTASHPAAQQSARRELSVVRPDQVQLVFRPERVTVAAGASTELRLLLNPVRGGATPVALGDAAVVDIKNGHPEAVRW